MPSGSHDINVKVLALMGIVSTVLTVALIVATQAWFRYEFNKENERKYVNVPYGELVEIKSTQLEALSAPAHTVEVKLEGEPTVTRNVIPIDEAMGLVIEANSTN